MLTDEEIQDVDSLSGIDAVGDRVVAGEQFDAFIAQAREANALRAEVERLRTSNANIIGDLALTEEVLSDTRAELAEARQQLAAQAPVIAAAIKVADCTEDYDTRAVDSLVDLADDYRLWLSQNPHADHANHVGTVTVQPDGAVKT